MLTTQDEAAASSLTTRDLNLIDHDDPPEEAAERGTSNSLKPMSLRKSSFFVSLIE